MKTKFRPILFSTEMVQAILNGTKTQTRRIIEFPSYNPKLEHKHVSKFEIKDFKVYDGNGDFEGNLNFRKGNVGDVLWVRETFREIEQDNGTARIEYKATETINLTDKWKPSIFMPKNAARLFLKVKSLKVERLQDITQSDAVAEGIKQVGVNMVDIPLYKIYNNLHPDKDGIIYPKWSFCSLWSSINGVESWCANPWVWVIEFERIDKPDNFLSDAN
jgi:hypothetical protein